MICKHCGYKIGLKNGVWHELLDNKQIVKLRKWSIEPYSGYTQRCIHTVSDGFECGEHEPTKESVVKRLLDKTDG